MATKKKSLQAAAGTAAAAAAGGADEFFNQTTLLLHGDGTQGGQNNTFLDESPNAFAITRNGNATQGSFSPFGDRWSNYFKSNDAYSDSLEYTSGGVTNFGASDFTIEFWFYPEKDDQPNGFSRAIFDSRPTESNDSGVGFSYGSGSFVYYRQNEFIISTGNVAPKNQWHHVAIVRSSGTVTVYVNGNSEVSGTDTATYTDTTFRLSKSAYPAAGVFGIEGYLSDFRVVIGTALYTSAFTPPTEPLTAVSGTSLLTCQSNRFKDNSSNNFTLTPNGSPSVTKFSPYAPSGTYIPAPPDINAVAFDGDDHLSIADSPAFDLSGDFTIEMWVYPNNPGGFPRLFAVGDTGNGTGINAFINANIGNVLDIYSVGTASAQQGTISIDDYAWCHIAIVRQGTGTNNIKAYINGVLDIEYTDNTSFTGEAANGVVVGASFANSEVYPTFKTQMSNFRIVQGTAVYTSAFTPPTEPLTAITNTSLLTCQDGFVDNSSNGFTITTNGNPKLIEFGPFGAGDGYWSNGFDGADDYLTAPNNSAFAFGTGDFTIEAWVYASSLANTMKIFSTSSGSGTSNIQFFTTSDGKLNANNANTLQIASTGTITANSWHHVAITKSSGTYYFWINGVASGNHASLGADDNLTDTSCRVGARPESPNLPWNGLISNLRVVKGTALYTANFTPSTTPLTAVSGTSLLTCQSNRFVDNSSNAFAITVNGDPEVLAANPFDDNIPEEVGSGYFDGTGDYLEIAANSGFTYASGDFTIEAWIYHYNSAELSYNIYSQRNSTDGITFRVKQDGSLDAFYGGGTGAFSTSTGIVAQQSWNHVALTRASGTTRIFLNGTEVASTAAWSGQNVGSNNALVIGVRQDTRGGEYFVGYMSGVRAVKGTALYTAAFTPPAQPLTFVPNTHLLLNFDNAEIYDSTGMNDLETVGNAQIDTSVVKYGTGSLKFDGTGDYLDVASTANMTFGNGDFTIELWMNTNKTNFNILNPSSATGSGFWGLIVQNGNLRWNDAYAASNLWEISASSILDATWHHIAITRENGSTKIFYDGVLQSTQADTTNYSGVTGWRIGSGNLGDLDGYIDDLRITKGVARYTANFTPPAQAFPDQ